MTSAVPVVIVGNPQGVEEGGVLEIPLRQVTLHCLPTQMPNDITVDVGHLDIGDSISVSDLTFDEEIDIIDEPERTNAVVSQPRASNLRMN